MAAHHEDTLAARFPGDGADEPVACHRAHGGHPALADAGTRARVVTRGNDTETAPRRGGFGRCVVLGAGLDSDAHRTRRRRTGVRRAARVAMYLGPHAAECGEPWLSLLRPAELAAPTRASVR
jgi:hypothetical protein